MHKAY